MALFWHYKMEIHNLRTYLLGWAWTWMFIGEIFISTVKSKQFFYESGTSSWPGWSSWLSFYMTDSKVKQVYCGQSGLANTGNSAHTLTVFLRTWYPAMKYFNTRTPVWHPWTQVRYHHLGKTWTHVYNCLKSRNEDYLCGSVITKPQIPLYFFLLSFVFLNGLLLGQHTFFSLLHA